MASRSTGHSVLPWLIVLLADAFVVVVASPVYSALASRAGNSGVALYLPPLYSSMGVGSGRWFVASTACSVAVLLILHPAIAARAARGDRLTDRLRSAAAPALAFAPLVGLLAALAKAAPAVGSLDALDYRSEELRATAVNSMTAGAFWGGVAGLSAAIGLVGLATLTRLPAEEELDPDGGLDYDQVDVDEDEELANLQRAIWRGLAIALPGLVAATLLLAVLGSPPMVSSVGSALRDILSTVRWSTPEPFIPGQYIAADYVPLAAVPAYVAALLVALPAAALTMRAGTAPIERLARGWLAVGAAVVVQAVVTGLALGTVAVAQQAPQLGGSWLRGYATVVNHCLTQLPAAAAYIALVGWIPAAAMAGAAWVLDRRADPPPPDSAESTGRIDAMTRTDIPETWDERAMLATFLDYARATVHAKCEGLSEADARKAPLATSPLMTISGLVSHLRWVEYSWIQVMLLGEEDNGPWTDEDPDREMRIGTEIPLAQLLAEYEAQCEHYRALVATLDLDTLSKRNISTGEPVTLRWILFHLIEETSRHNGHIDILREMADGVTGD